MDKQIWQSFDRTGEYWHVNSLFEEILIVPKGFYDTASDSFYEPALTGISYSFSADGHYEEALFRSIPNRMYYRHL